MRRAASIPVPALVCLLGALLPGCAKKTDPVRETIDAVVKAANARDTAAVMARVAPDFEAADGTARLDLEVRLNQYFAAYEILNVSISDVTIERGGGAALVRFRARMSGQPRAVGGLSGLLPSEAQYDFEVRLVNDGEAWKIGWAGWKQVEG
jgi:hypothetical protein